MTGLRDRLVQLYLEGIGWPCLGNDLWLSDDPRERQGVAALCLTCPCLIECRTEADANAEDFGIWAGRDRGSSVPPRPGRTGDALGTHTTTDQGDEATCSIITR